MAGVAISRRIRPTAPLTGVCCDQLITCEQLIGLAAEELAAFLAVVNQEFGSEQACQAAGDWLQQDGRKVKNYDLVESRTVHNLQITARDQPSP
jgi:hypothetical protein